MQDSLESLYQCFLWTAQFAESCSVYAKLAKEDDDKKFEKLFDNLSKQYSQLSGNFLQMFQNAKDQDINNNDNEIATEIGAFLGASDTHENLINTIKNIKQFSDEILSICTEVCGQEGLMEISNQCRSILEMVKEDIKMLES